MATITFTRSGSQITIQKDALPALTLQGDNFTLDPSNDNTVLRVFLPTGGCKNYYLTDSYTIAGAAFSGTTAAELATELRNKIFYPIASRQVLASNVPLSHTGNTTETTVYTGTIPANSIGANGSFWILAILSGTNNANNKVFRVKFNGTAVMQYTHVSAATAKVLCTVHNRNSLTSQVIAGGTGAFPNTALGTSGQAVTAFSFNTGADIAITVTVQLATATDAAAVETLSVVAVNS